MLTIISICCCIFICFVQYCFCEVDGKLYQFPIGTDFKSCQCDLKLDESMAPIFIKKERKRQCMQLLQKSIAMYACMYSESSCCNQHLYVCLIPCYNISTTCMDNILINVQFWHKIKLHEG